MPPFVFVVFITVFYTVRMRITVKSTFANLLLKHSDKSVKNSKNKGMMLAL